MGSTDTEIKWTKEYRHQPTSSEQTLAQRREHPYIWTTWLPRLLTGENSCEWAIWFKAHHQNWAKVPSDFNQAEWMLNHTSLLNEKKSQWEARRQKVYVEGQNSFRLRGQSATLAGRPDLIVERSNDALIIDIKAGRVQPAHVVQIMIYMYALPRASPQYQHGKLAGEIVYPTRTRRVPMGSLHTQFKTDLGSLIRRTAADKPAARVPSEHECRFCDITAEDCPGPCEQRPVHARWNNSGILKCNQGNRRRSGSTKSARLICRHALVQVNRGLQT